MPIEVALAALAALAFYGYCLFDLARSDPQSVRFLPKAMWLALLVLTTVLGDLLWIAAGRPRRPATRYPTGSSARVDDGPSPRRGSPNNEMNTGGPVG